MATARASLFSDEPAQSAPDAGPGAIDHTRSWSPCARQDAYETPDRYHDRDDDDSSSIAPFPAYREPEEGDDEEGDGEGDDEGDGEEDDGLVATHAADGPSPSSVPTLTPKPTPPPPPESTPPEHDSDVPSASRVRLFSDATARPGPAPGQPPKPPSPPPAPPPPYWKHSRDASVSATNGITSTPSRLTDKSPPPEPEPAPAASSSRLATPAPTLRTKQSKGLQLFVGRPATPKVPKASKVPNVPKKGNAPSPDTQSNGHRRDTSASTLELAANQITLQDNEADEDREAREAREAHEAEALLPRPVATRNAWLFGLDAPSASTPTPTSPTPPTPPTPPSPGLHSPGSATPSGRPTSGSRANRCWARRVDILGHQVVNGSESGTGPGMLGAYTVWTVRVETLGKLPFAPPSTPAPATSHSPPGSPPRQTVHTFFIHKRYSDFDALRRRLVRSFPQARGALPPLPPKGVLLGNFKPAFLEQRRLGLQYFLNCTLLNPEFGGSPILRDFLFR